MKLLTIKKIVSAGAVVILIGIVGIFFGLPTASALPIRVLDLSNTDHHTAAFANIHGDFLNTRFNSLETVTLSLFDVLYVGEHPGTAAAFFGREADVRAAIISGNLSLVAENDSPWSSISAIIGEAVTRTNDIGPNSLTPAGAGHPIFTGIGIPGGSAPIFGNLDAEDAFSAIPLGATVLVKDDDGKPVMFAGTLGLGRYFITGTELTEKSGDTADNLLAHNAIHFVSATTPAPVPEPATVILFGSGMAVLFCYRRFKRKDGDA